MLLKCVRNDSKTLQFTPGLPYVAEDIGGMFKIFDNKKGHILSPINGHYVELVKVIKKPF